MVENCGSRRGVSLLPSQAKEAFKEGEEYTQLFISRAEEGKEEKDELLRQVHYKQLIEEVKELVEGYLYERKDGAESEMSEKRNPLEHKEETIQVKGQKEDSVGKVEGWIRDNQWRKAPKESEGRTVPDAWIEEYVSGRILPEELIQDGGRPSARVELETYDGKALTWFEWIDMFRCLVHESGRPAGEKLALLKRSLKGPCQDIVYGLGGGDEAYKEALIRLKVTCGRRDVMRTVHINTIDSLEPGQNPSSFKRYAEKIRTHLFDLTRSGVGRNLDIVEKVCAKLNLQDRLAWTEQNTDGASLNEFGRWLCPFPGSVQQHQVGVTIP